MRVVDAIFGSLQPLGTLDPLLQRRLLLTTVLVQQEGTWKVDVNKTMMSIFGGAMGEMMEQMGEAMQEMGESMAEGMQMQETTDDNDR